MFVFRKNWCALFSWNTHIEIRLLAYYWWIIQNSDDHSMEIRQTCLHYHGNFENLRYIIWIEVYPSAIKKQSKSRQSLFFNKVVGLRLATLLKNWLWHRWPATLLKERLWRRCFPVNFAKFLKTPYLKNTSGDCFWGFLRFFVTYWFLK